MKTVRTIKTYTKSIREKYLKDEELGKLKGNLYSLTRSNIRNVCLNLVDGKLSKVDEKIMRNFFKLREEDDLRNSVKKYNIEGFRPIYNFLKGTNESIQSIDALELMAIMIDFNPRPFVRYRSNKHEDESYEKVINEDIIYDNDQNNGKSIITVKPKNKRSFTWFSTASAANKFFSVIIASLVFASIGTGIYFKVNEPRWMVWNENHYIEVTLDNENYNISQLKFYKEERIKYFKKINVECKTDFFNDDGSVKIWYGKNRDKELEYFTAIGLHPETGKTLKPITQYMINKYICN